MAGHIEAPSGFHVERVKQKSHEKIGEAIFVVLDRYVDLQSIGSGAQGVVWCVFIRILCCCVDYLAFTLVLHWISRPTNAWLLRNCLNHSQMKPMQKELSENYD